MEKDVIKIITYLNLMELSVDKTICEKNIFDAYKKMAKAYHPDAHISIWSDGKKFNELVNAKKYLLENITYVNTLIRNNFVYSGVFSEKKEENIPKKPESSSKKVTIKFSSIFLAIILIALPTIVLTWLILFLLISY